MHHRSPLAALGSRRELLIACETRLVSADGNIVTQEAQDGSAVTTRTKDGARRASRQLNSVRPCSFFVRARFSRQTKHSHFCAGK